MSLNSGLFYASTAESLKYVELPFEPNDNWVRLTSDVEIRVRQVRNEASRYQFEIEQRSERVTDPAHVRIGDYLPSGFVVDRQIIIKTGSNGAGIRSAPGSIGGKGSGTGRAEKIRFTIAANPAHKKIPFEFEQIPLSVLTEPVLSRSPRSIRREFAPVKIMPEQAKAQFDEKVADYFKVHWNWVTYRKMLYNPSVSQKNPDRSLSERLYVNCEAEILDPKLVVGTCHEPVIEQITDGNGRQIDIGWEQTHPDRMSYRSLEYRIKNLPPSKLFQWEGKVRSTLGLPLSARHRSKRGLELQPVRLRIELDPQLIRQEQEEIGSIKGYFHALSAKSLKHVKVLFKSSDNWVRLTSDVEIQVSKVWRTGSTTLFEIKQRGQRERCVSRLCLTDQLPGEFVVDSQFIKPDGQPYYPRNRPTQQLPTGIGGSLSIGSGIQIEKIDYLIAVGPDHYKIPFEIEHIPLPGF